MHFPYQDPEHNGCCLLWLAFSKRKKRSHQDTYDFNNHIFVMKKSWAFGEWVILQLGEEEKQREKYTFLRSIVAMKECMNTVDWLCIWDTRYLSKNTFHNWLSKHGSYCWHPNTIAWLDNYNPRKNTPMLALAVHDFKERFLSLSFVN
mmetsp:Transcript_5773/g.21826  ORF Transcript_5773/g.21826 Transcript_5773/m.21826 type:complete len:148 (-) Transcript_5773:182-625(-)